MARNFTRSRIRSGGRAKIRQAGAGSNRVSVSIPRGVRANLRIKRG